MKATITVLFGWILIDVVFVGIMYRYGNAKEKLKKSRKDSKL